MQMTRRFALRQILARKQSFYKLLASFFVMLILPLVLVLANYFYARGLLQQENINYQNAVLTQAQMSMDERLQTIQLYAIDLSNDTVLNATLSQRQADDSQGNFELWELSRHLQSYSATAGSFAIPPSTPGCTTAWSAAVTLITAYPRETFGCRRRK